MENIERKMEEHGSMELIGLLHRAVRFMGRARHQHGRSGHAQRRILALLTARGSMEQKELLEELDVRSTSLSEILGKLEHKGLISRERDSGDRRGFIISPTEEARTMMAGHDEEHRQGADSLFKEFSEEEKASLKTLLEKLVSGMEANSPFLGNGEDEHRHGHHEGRRGCCGRHGHHRHHEHEEQREHHGHHEHHHDHERHGGPRHGHGRRRHHDDDDFLWIRS